MTDDNLWAVRTNWPGVVGGVNRRGPHDASDPLSGLNISYLIGDAPERVAHTRSLLLGSLGAADWPVVRAQQVHGTHVALVRRQGLADLMPCPSGVASPQTDGLVTDEPCIMLNLAFADCVPILLYCPRPLIAGLIHAGWRGTAGAIALEGVRAMESLGAVPADIRALIGPAICGKCYEVGPEVVLALRALPAADQLLAGDPQTHVDLAELNRLTLLAAGVPEESVTMSGICTFCGDVDMFSYRKSGGGQGLHGAFMGICPDRE